MTDPQQRAKFDATRRSGMGKYPASSGVRGNPWSNVSQQFPTPPKHPSTPSRNPTSGANRWNTRFSSGVPPTARQQTAADAQSKKNTAKAFDNMRSKPPPTAKQAHQNRAPPPTPPRTESARQRAQASFGASKAGKASTHTDHPRQFPYEDEPPATKNGYSSRKDGSRFNLHPESQATPVPDPLRQFREEMAFADGRTRSPYASHGGERTNPFDGADMSRSKSTRETSTREGQGQSPNKEGTWGNGTSFRTEANAKNSSSKKSPPTEARSRRLSGAWPTEETREHSVFRAVICLHANHIFQHRDLKAMATGLQCMRHLKPTHFCLLFQHTKPTTTLFEGSSIQLSWIQSRRQSTITMQLVSVVREISHLLGRLLVERRIPTK